MFEFTVPGNTDTSFDITLTNPILGTQVQLPEIKQGMFHIRPDGRVTVTPVQKSMLKYSKTNSSNSAAYYFETPETARWQAKQHFFQICFGLLMLSVLFCSVAQAI